MIRNTGGLDVNALCTRNTKLVPRTAKFASSPQHRRPCCHHLPQATRCLPVRCVQVSEASPCILKVLFLLQHLHVKGVEAVDAERHLAHLAHHAGPLEPQPQAGVPQAAERPGAAFALAADGPRKVVAAQEKGRVLLLLLLLLSCRGGGCLGGVRRPMLSVEDVHRNKWVVIEEDLLLVCGGRRVVYQGWVCCGQGHLAAKYLVV